MALSQTALPTLFAVFLWWVSTGVIVFLDGLPRRTFRWSMAGSTALCGLAFYGLAASSGDASVTGAYVAFSCALMVWGWHEMAFLMGFVTGPRPEPCPANCRGWRRFGYAFRAILYHEVAIAATLVIVVACTWDGPNQVGAWTFAILWLMRLSAKLNLFLGVPNLYEEFLPEHLRFLQSYFRRRPLNLLFPLSVTSATAVAALLVQSAASAGAGAFEAAGATFLATLLALAILEHWFMVLPLPAASLWGWGLKSHGPRPLLQPEIAAGSLGSLHPNPASSHRRLP